MLEVGFVWIVKRLHVCEPWASKWTVLWKRKMDIIYKRVNVLFLFAFNLLWDSFVYLNEVMLFVQSKV